MDRYKRFLWEFWACHLQRIPWYVLTPKREICHETDLSGQIQEYSVDSSPCCSLCTGIFRATMKLGWNWTWQGLSLPGSLPLIAHTRPVAQSTLCSFTCQICQRYGPITHIHDIHCWKALKDCDEDQQWMILHSALMSTYFQADHVLCCNAGDSACTPVRKCHCCHVTQAAVLCEHVWRLCHWWQHAECSLAASPCAHHRWDQVRQDSLLLWNVWSAHQVVWTPQWDLLQPTLRVRRSWAAVIVAPSRSECRAVQYLCQF